MQNQHHKIVKQTLGYVRRGDITNAVQRYGVGSIEGTSMHQ
jgi:hypothetical protein